MTRNTLCYISTALVMGVFAVPVMAATQTVTISGGKLAPSRLTVKAGDYVIFKNADTKTHNLYSASPEDAFQFYSLSPGESKNRAFTHVGRIEIHCASHASEYTLIEVTA